MLRGQSTYAAAEAARRLGVSRATLYAYVSRGFIRSQPVPGPRRERAYLAEDVERLRRRTEERRAPDKAAAHALQWGLPILESSIALIDGQHLYYRGVEAAALARGRTLEDVAGLIWSERLEPIARPAAAAPAGTRRPFISRAQSLLAEAAARDAAAMDLRPPALVRTGTRVVRLLTAAAVGTVPAALPAHALLARRWKTSAADIVRAALVLCADHELNVSSFTARCVASAGSHPYAAVIAALSALEGPKHGGASARVESMFEAAAQARRVRAAIEARMRRGEPIDGFGHPLYRDGDPRARLLLERLADDRGRSAAYRFVSQVADAASVLTGEHPNLDFALAAVARVLDLPPRAPLMMFAIGRSVGWIGHAMEQYAVDQLIRPRARYVGPAPAERAASA